MEQKQKVTDILKTKKVLASKQQVWVSPADKPMLADDTELEKMFTAKEGVHFLTLELPKAANQRGGPRRRLGGARGKSVVVVEESVVVYPLWLTGLKALTCQLRFE